MQPQNSNTILIADDEGMVRSVLKLLLVRNGYQIAEAVDGQDAVNQFTRDPERFALVLLDVQMPNLDGPQALAAMRQTSPQLKAILLTGALEPEADEAQRNPQTRLVHKPFENKALLREVRDLIGA